METLLKSVPGNLQRAWAAVSCSVHFPLFARHSPVQNWGLYSVGKIPEGAVVFTVQDTIPGQRLAQVEEFKAMILRDVLEYTASLHPDRPKLLETLNISFQLSQMLRNPSNRLSEYVNTLPTEHLKFPIY